MWIATTLDHGKLGAAPTKREAIALCGCDSERVKRLRPGAYEVTSKTSGRSFYVGRADALRAEGFDVS